MCTAIRDARPDVVLGHDPWKQYRFHPDHRHAGQLVIDGVVAARDPHFFPGAGVPHRPERLLLFEAQVVDHIEVVTDDDVQTKVDALLCHRSQWRSTMRHRRSQPPRRAEQRAAFERADPRRISAAGGEQFKLLTERGVEATLNASTTRTQRRRRGPGGPLRIEAVVR